jgi:hypothetical protein
MPSRGSSWTREEVEATVASYFKMLELGLRAEPFNKTEHRRTLLPLLGNRSPGAVERKHQNISAVLIEERLPYISGYKPLGNYQGLLRDIVLQQLAGRPALLALIEAEAKRTPPLPSFDDILRRLTDPPRPRPGLGTPRRPPTPTARSPVDYLLMEARNQALGRAGEEFVVDLERARLEAAGMGRLAASVSHVAVERGDGLGYDVLSYEEDSRERLIEVKTTKFGEYTPFYVSVNELDVSREERNRYHLFRVYSFGPDARVFQLPGALDHAFSLSPSQFIARVN